MKISYVMLVSATIWMISCLPSKAQMSTLEVQKMSHDIFKELIEINTTVGYGSTKASRAMADRLLSAGFPEKDVLVIGPNAKNKNLVVRFHGSGKLKPVLFICHLDVVEALSGDWSMDPYRFNQKDGYFFGRGTTDVKCEDAQLITNLIRLKKENFKPDRDIIVALTDCEEGGDFNGVEWLLNNRKDLIDAEFCINPDGGGGDLKEGKQFAIYIQTSEKIYLTVQFESTNNGGHSSLPVRDNAIYHLAGALDRLSDYDFPVNLNETTRELFQRQAKLETGQDQSDMISLASGNTDELAVERLREKSPFYNAMMRTTCVATMLKGGHADNALPQSAIATVNCRMLPADNPDSVLETIKKVVADTSVKVSMPYVSINAPASPLRNDLLKSVEKTTQSMWPGVSVFPVMSTGATDGRFLRKAGMPVYGISGMFGDPEDVRAHGRDERIKIECFDEGVEFMYRFIKDITTR